VCLTFRYVQAKNNKSYFVIESDPLFVDLFITIFCNISHCQGYGDQSSRPTIDKLEDDSMVQLDRWGRPKAASFTMPTVALPDDVDPNNPGLLPSLVMRAVEGVDIDSKTSSPNNNEASDVKTTRE